MQRRAAVDCNSPCAMPRKSWKSCCRCQISTAVVFLAWLLRRSPVVLPITGNSNVKHLEENVSAAGFRLSDAEFAEIAVVAPKPYWLRA